MSSPPSQAAIYYHNNNSMQNHYSVQVILKVLNANDNNNNTTTVSIDNYSSNDYAIAKRHFVICNSCFWCASLYSDLRRIIKCPLCNSYTNLESIPISENESFKFNHDSGKGMELEFTR
jgi:hypothetical protein